MFWTSSISLRCQYLYFCTRKLLVKASKLSSWSSMCRTSRMWLHASAYVSMRQRMWLRMCRTSRIRLRTSLTLLAFTSNLRL
jgi:hypothetical protein